MSAGPPEVVVPVPDAIAALAEGQPVRAVWVNELGGITFTFGRWYAKWASATSNTDLVAEAVRLRWAGSFTRVPRVVDVGHDREGSWMVTEALRGSDASAPVWRARPEVAVRAVGVGLRAFHDALPVAACPFSWSADVRVADARRRAASGLIEPGRWHPEHRAHGLDRALALLDEPPPDDLLVVCHGDACVPNTLLDDHGHWLAHVDLGSLGIADRWADIAVAAWSTAWNYGPGWERAFLDAYGVAADHERMAYYRLLWDLGP